LKPWKFSGWLGQRNWKGFIKKLNDEGLIATGLIAKMDDKAKTTGKKKPHRASFAGFLREV
jgi:hypothetical protein